MKLANVSVERPVAISMLIIALVLLGLFSLPKLGVDLYPDMNFPAAVVVTSYSGADPEEVEKMVTKPLEQAVGTVSNVKEIQSLSQSGNSLVVILFEWDTDMDSAVADIREKMDLYREMLPESAGSPMIMKMDPNQAPILLYTMSGADVVKLKQIAEDKVINRLERIDGVASVAISGGREREYKITLDPAKIETYGLTIGQVMQAISTDNISGTVGDVEKGTNKLSVKVQGEYNELEDLANVQISTGQSSIRLGDVAVVEESHKEITDYTFMNGKNAIGLDVFKASGKNTVQVSRDVKAEIEKINKSLPEGIKIDIVMDNAKFIENSIETVVSHTAIGGILAVIILYLFLRSARSTLVVAITMPIAVIATFTMMYFGHLTINMLSLGGLALGLGSLVDFSVVVLENIYRHRQNGVNIIDAAKIGTAEVNQAVTASALAQVVVFAPIIFVEGLAGILFGPMAMTVSFSHIAALFAALTLVPMMSSRLLKNVSPENEELAGGNKKNPVVIFGRFFKKVSNYYGKLLKWALNHRKTVILVTVVMLVGSFALVPLVGTEFIPGMDQGEIDIQIEMPAGTMLEEAKRLALDVEHIAMSELDDIDTVYTRVGTGDMSFLGIGNAEEATVRVKLKPLEERHHSTEEAVDILTKALENVPGASINVGKLDPNSAMAGKPVSITVKGDDLQVLNQLGDLLVETVKNVPGTRNVENSLDKARSEIQLIVDREQAARYGLSANQILTAVSTAMDGKVVTRVLNGEEEIDVRLKYPENYARDYNQLSNLVITTPTGARVPVSSVAEIVESEIPVTISRADQTRQVTISADIEGRDLGSINSDIQAQIDKLALPDGYIIELGGQAEDMQESFGDLGVALILSIVLVYMVMAAQFESLLHPFVIMFSLPPTFIGVVLGLLITGNPLSVPALIGAIMLVGIVVNNAIVLIDYVNNLRRKGLGLNEAILQAGPIRLRPIIMTALTTVLALVPLVIATGEGSEGMKPMAVVVSFGLTVSTVITLVLVPVVYTLFEDFLNKLRGWKIKRKPSAGEVTVN
ncbi:efflux RND transporter permease subunit [Desulfolucanica intricata]|uniref:efflux RND transporter permease subunit n=1 Tax=Desulfolucanica intricata TaxID=1285191 RepID=UPI00082C8D0D|nr:efflux RND transporter permease subunit [Desulfolucanica intricata]